MRQGTHPQVRFVGLDLPGQRVDSRGVDVRPSMDGSWFAECECGKQAPTTSEVEGWLWLANHECGCVWLPVQRSSALDEPSDTPL